MHTIKSITAVFGIVGIMLTSCGKTEREAASQYYDDFSAIIVPYKQGTERVVDESQMLLQKQLKATGDLNLSYTDSIRLHELLSELEMLGRKTVDALHTLDDFPGSELKRSGIDYVNTSVNAILGAYRGVGIPGDRSAGELDQELLDSLSAMYSDSLFRSNGEFASSQMQFLLKFDLMKH